MTKLNIVGNATWQMPDERAIDADFRQASLPEQLRRIARGMRSTAASFEGCTWMGTYPPGYYDNRNAGILEKAADMLEKGEHKTRFDAVMKEAAKPKRRKKE